MSKPGTEKTSVWPIVLGLVAVPLVGAAVIVATETKPERPDVGAEALESERLDEPEPPSPTAAPDEALVDDEPPDEETEPEEPPPVDEAHAVADDNGAVVAAEKIAKARRVENTDPRLARQLLRDALAADPDNPRALEQLAAKTLMDEKGRGARDLAKRCAQVNSGSRMCERVLRLAPDETPELKYMVEGVKDCARKAPDNVACQAGMVGYHLSEGDVTEAAKVTGKLTQLAPGSAETLLAQGRIEATKENYGAALKYFQSSCEAQRTEDACLRADILREEGW